MSIRPTLILTNNLCEKFSEDALFESVRASLRETGELDQWTKIASDGCSRPVKNLLDAPIMDYISFNQERLEVGKRIFKILIDASGFRPEDIKCSLTPNLLEVAAHKFEMIDSVNKNITTTRSYQLPRSVKPEYATCCISSDGLLLITAPWLR